MYRMTCRATKFCSLVAAMLVDFYVDLGSVSGDNGNGVANP